MPAPAQSTHNSCQHFFLAKLKMCINETTFDNYCILFNQIKGEKFIFFYGGKDNEWVQQFTKRAKALAIDPVIKEARISIELLCVGKGSKGEDDHSILGHFWNRIDSFFFSKAHKKTEEDAVTHEINKLLSYKNGSGWVVLCKGSIVVARGHGASILKVLE
jgi:hypothetical protein